MGWLGSMAFLLGGAFVTAWIGRKLWRKQIDVPETPGQPKSV